MRRLAQDKGGTSRIAKLPMNNGSSASALVVALGLFGLLASTASAAPVGCAGTPGSPDRAALLQYCPKTAGSGSGSEAGAGGTSADGSGGAAGSLSGQGKKTASGKSDKPELPLTGYPSTGGVNLTLTLLLVVALGLGVAYGARRWRRSRPEAS